MKKILTTLLIVCLFSCKHKYADCDRPIKDSSVGFMLHGAFGRKDVSISIVNIINRKDWNFNLHFTGDDWSSDEYYEMRVPQKDSCKLKELYFKYFEK